MKVVRVVVGSAMTLLICASAHAQTTGSISADSARVDETREASRIHAGPLYLTPRVVLKQLGMDENVFYESQAPKRDFTFAVAPLLATAVPVTHRALFTTTVASDLVYFKRYVSERSIDPELSGRGEIYLNHLTLYAADSYIASRQRPNFEIDVRSRRTDNLADAGLVWHFTPKFSVDAGARRRTLHYDADAFFEGSSLHDTLNHESTGAALTPRFSATPLTTFAVRMERLEERFPFAPVRDNDTLRVMPGMELKPRALISGSAYVGYRRLTPHHEELPAYQGVAVALGLSYTLMQATSFAVTFDRDLQHSIEIFQPYYQSEAFGASLRRALAARVDVALSAQRYRYTFAHFLTAPAPFDKRQDRVGVYSATLGYRVGNVGRLGIGAWYTKRDSDRPDKRFDGLRFGSTMTYGF